MASFSKRRALDELLELYHKAGLQALVDEKKFKIHLEELQRVRALVTDL